ncbi:MAG: M48 family metallopeptidase, partial [Bdellovibrionales bacterium]|nr:M48 family metallopeptidase [Bdellovibrionales bacterium]
MNFFQAQEKARKKTKTLVLLFSLAILFIVFAIYIPVQWILWQTKLEGQKILISSVCRKDFYDLVLLSKVAGAVVSLILAISFFKWMKLSKGGGIIAKHLGGREVSIDPDDFYENRLRNVVEEMSIASGIRVPEIYLMDRELSINAFAAGCSVDDAAISITRGAIEKLTRDELQAVVAHEFSHILNGDMKLNIRLMGLLYGIWFISMIGRWMVNKSVNSKRRMGRSSQSSSGFVGGIIVGMALFLVGGIGYFFGKVIQAAVSRQREYLADASAVQFTRNLEGIAGALKKIAGYTLRNDLGSSLGHVRAGEISHMTFSTVDLVSNAQIHFLSTHPPIDERILLVDPSFDPKKYSKKDQSESWAQDYLQKEADLLRSIEQKQNWVSGFERARGHEEKVDEDIDPLKLAGTMQKDHLDYAKHFLEYLPHLIYKASHHPQKAKALVCVLMSEDSHEKSKLIQDILKAHAPDMLPIYLEFELPIQALGVDARLPLMDLCLPALSKLPKSDYVEFAKILQMLIESDRKLSTFEVLVLFIVRSHLAPKFFKFSTRKIMYRKLSQVESKVEKLLAHLSLQEHQDPQAKEVFLYGMKELRTDYQKQYDLRQLSPKELYELLSDLKSCAPLIKGEILGACAKLVMFDQSLSRRESELIRAIAEALSV